MINPKSDIRFCVAIACYTSIKDSAIANLFRQRNLLANLCHN